MLVGEGVAAIPDGITPGIVTSPPLRISAPVLHELVHDMGASPPGEHPGIQSCTLIPCVLCVAGM